MWSWIAVQRRALFARQRRGSSICVRGIVLCVKCHSTKTRIPSDGRFVVGDGRRQGGQTGEVGMLLAPLVFPIWVIMWSGFFTMVRSCKMVWAGWWDVENFACSRQKNAKKNKRHHHLKRSKSVHRLCFSLIFLQVCTIPCTIYTDFYFSHIFRSDVFQKNLGVSQISGWMESCLTLLLGGSQILLFMRLTTNAESIATAVKIIKNPGISAWSSQKFLWLCQIHK